MLIYDTFAVKNRIVVVSINNCNSVLFKFLIKKLLLKQRKIHGNKFEVSKIYMTACISLYKFDKLKTDF